MNLSAFVDNDGNFNFDEFADAVFTATVALNKVLDEGLPLHPLQEQRYSVRDWRQIGLGIFGLADMLIKMGVRYGSEDSLNICNHIADYMLNYSLLASATLAQNNGHSFPKYRYDELVKSKFFQSNVWSTTCDAILSYGLYNSQLLTIAPTGTLSTMLGVSGGIEPIFANYYTRKTESLYGEDKYYKVYTPIVREYMNKHNLADDSELPSYFVTAGSLDYKQRIRMQGIWQSHIDASISSTVNLPNEATVEDVENLYIEAWKAGLKGITVFRDGCERAAILSTDKPKESQSETQSSTELPRGYIITTTNDCVGKKRKLQTGCGSLHCTAFFDPVTGDLMETYLSKGSTGGCANFMVGLSRMISLAARAGCGIDSIIDQLDSCGACPSYAVRRATKHDTSKGSCCPMAVGNALRDMWEEMQNELKVDEEDLEVEEFTAHVDDMPVATIKKTVCPECGEPVRYEGGCISCPNCGYSKCD